MPRQKDPPRWLSWLLLACGAYIVLTSLGVLPGPPIRGKWGIFTSAEHWQATSIGLMFCSAAVALAFGNRRHWLVYLNRVVLAAALVAPLGWLLFFSGEVELWLQVVGGLVLLVAGVACFAPTASLGQAATSDPLQVAEVYLAYGRKAQAVELLTAALQRHPDRAAEIRRKLEEIRRAG